MNQQQLNPLLPTVTIDPLLGKNHCRKLPTCTWFYNQMHEVLVGRYIAAGQPFAGQIIAARLGVHKLQYPDYVAEIRRSSKGAVPYEVRKADRQGYVSKPFPYALFVPDIVAINHSKEVRSGGPMRAAYRRTVEEMGGAPPHAIAYEPPECPVHYDLWWGIFAPEPGYRQGNVVTNERLLGYIRLRRNGNYALYAQILGHGNYLRHGIMYRLHCAILEWISRGGDGLALGLEHLIYAGYYQGKEGLIRWKRKLLFEPAYLILCEVG